MYKSFPKFLKPLELRCGLKIQFFLLKFYGNAAKPLISSDFLHLIFGLELFLLYVIMKEWEKVNVLMCPMKVLAYKYFSWTL